MGHIDPKEIDLLIKAKHFDPFRILGCHYQDPFNKKGIVVRAFVPDAKGLFLVERKSRKKHPMERIRDEGFFQIEFPQRKRIFDYFFIKDNGKGAFELEDPYRFGVLINDFDLHLFSEGKHHHIYQSLGARPTTIDKTPGVLFALWAPNAKRVSVVGDFNLWDGRVNPMRNRGTSGVWELFIPGLSDGALYKFEILTSLDEVILKTDPFGFFQETRPKTASVVTSIDQFEWKDQDYLKNRKEKDFLNQPINIYEVHLGSWKRKPEQDNRPLSYREIADQLIPYVKEMGYTHIELMPVAEHPLDDSWGYQVTGYYSVTSRFGTPADLKYFIEKCHLNDIGVILDWVPGHFPKDSHGLARFDGTCLYEHSDPREGEHPHWGTLIFNYGRNEVSNFLLSNAIFWLKEYHFDGLRVDAVASMLYRDYGKEEGEWVPNIYGGNENLEAIEFLRRMNETVHEYFPGVLMLAEESTAFPGVSRPVYLGGLGFGFKWNMGWMHDSLEYVGKDPIHRKYHHNDITFSLVYAFNENFVLVISHDEVVHGKKSLIDKMPGDLWRKFANNRLFMLYAMTHPGKKHFFMGCEFGQWREWDFKNSLDWHLLQYAPHKKLLKFVKDINHFYKDNPCLWEEDFRYHGFEWIDFHDAESSVISYIRRGKNYEDVVVCILNWTPISRSGYRVGVPVLSKYEEAVNSDSEIYWGSNVGNNGSVQAEPIAWQGQPFSVLLDIPPLGGLILKPTAL